MNMKLTLIGLPLLLTSAALQAADIPEVTDPTMQQTRTRQQAELQSMSSEDRALYQQLNRDDVGNGNMNRIGEGSGDGSGDKNRHRKRYEYRVGDGSGGGGYGSGYGSRAGGGQGGGQGRN